MEPGGAVAQVDDDVLAGSARDVHHADQARSLVLDDADAEVLVPHSVSADGGGAQVRQDRRPAGVADEGGVVPDAQLVRQEAQVVDVRLVRAGVPDGADQDEFGGRLRLLLGCRRCGFGVLVADVVEEAGEGAEDQRVVLFRAELRDVQDGGFADLLALQVHLDRGLELRDRGRGEDDRGFLVHYSVVAPARRAPEGFDMRRRPRRVAHHHVDLAADPAVETGERKPVLPLCVALPARSGARVDSLQARLVVQRFEHVRGDRGVVDISSRGDGWEEKFAECNGKGVAHGIDEHVRDQKVEGIVSDDKGAQRLSEKGHVWVHAAQDVLARGEIE